MRRILPGIAVALCLHTTPVLSDPLYGGPVQGTEPPSGAVPTPLVGPPQVGNPENQGSSPNQEPANPAQNPSNQGPYNPLQNNPNAPGLPLQNSGQPGQENQSGQPVSNAPTFMNGALPNTQNPFLPTGITPGTLTSPLTNLFELQGVPALAAPLMGQVYRPFGLTLYQPNPFQVVPQGYASLSGSFETDTNINYSPTNPQVGSLYSITPAVAYSNFDDYGYLSAMASASYTQYDTGNIPPYLSEMGGVSAGTYLGNRVFVGVEDFLVRGEMPESSGSPLQFLNGIDPFFSNTMGAEAGFALTPKISFVETAMDSYFDGTAFGAGIMNVQSLAETLSYIDKTSMLSATYTYATGMYSFFPDFISNGASGMAMHALTHSTSAGIGGNYTYYMMQGEPLLNFDMITAYGLINHTFNRNVTASIQGGANDVIFATGQSYLGPLLDANITYQSGPLGLALNAGWFEEDQISFGVAMGPEDVKQIMATISYRISPRTSFMASGGYAIYKFFNAPAFSNNFFQTLQPSQSYEANTLMQTDGIFWRPNNWLMTSLEYNLVDFSTNIPNETVIDNQFIAMVSIYFPF
jgi:hypothetical protein